MKRVDDNLTHILTGETLRIKVSAYLNGLLPEDVALECVIGRCNDHKDILSISERHRFEYQCQEGNNHIFALDLKPSKPGLNHYKIRMYPHHTLLAHPLDTGHLIWL